VNGVNVSLRSLSAEHLAGTPLERIVPQGLRDELLAVSRARDVAQGSVTAVLVDGLPVGYVLVRGDGQVLGHIAPEGAGRGVGKSVVAKVVAKARPHLDRVWATVRPMTAGEATARHAGLVEVARVSAVGERPAEVTLETVPRMLFHYTAIENLPSILRSSALRNRLVKLSADDDDMKVAATVFEEVIGSKTTIPGGFPTAVQRDAWRPCIDAASYDGDQLGMTCFSTDPDAKALWDFPAPDVPSVALQVESEPLLVAARKLDAEAAFVCCLADEQAQARAVDSLLETISVPTAGAPAAIVLSYPPKIAREFAYRFVYSGFGGENEWRLLLHTANRNGDGDIMIEGMKLLSVRVQPEYAAAQLADVRAQLEAVGYGILGVDDNVISVEKR
jgi:hypothetical protein